MGVEPPSDAKSNRCPTCGVLLHSGMQPCRPLEPPPDSLVLCTDPDCDVAWAYRDPPTDHWHPRPHGPELPCPDA